MAGKEKKHTIWIGIDPNLLLGGLDTKAMFGCENYLKFNLNPRNKEEQKEDDGAFDDVVDGGYDEADDHNYEGGDGEENEDGEEPFKLEVEPKFDLDEVKEEVASEEESNDDEMVHSFEQEMYDYEDNESETGNNESETGNADGEAVKLERTNVKSERPSESATKNPGVGRGQTKRDHTKKIADLKCGRCQKTFCLEKSYKRHLKIDACVVKGEGYIRPCLLPALCPECGGTFKTRSKMLQHIRDVHLNVKPHSCDQCEKAFVNAYKLKRHVETKHSTSEHICDFCSKLFKAEPYLNDHIRRDHNEHCVSCPKCNKNFMKQANLDLHLANGICDQPRQDLLNEKKKIVAKLKKDPCPHCNKIITSSKGGLRKHIERVHVKGTGMSPKGKSQRCTYCEFHTPFEKKLQIHMDLMHPEMYNPYIGSKEREQMKRSLQ